MALDVNDTNPPYLLLLPTSALIRLTFNLLSALLLTITWDFDEPIRRVQHISSVNNGVRSKCPHVARRSSGQIREIAIYIAKIIQKNGHTTVSQREQEVSLSTSAPECAVRVDLCDNFGSKMNVLLISPSRCYCYGGRLPTPTACRQPSWRLKATVIRCCHLFLRSSICSIIVRLLRLVNHRLIHNATATTRS